MSDPTRDLIFLAPVFQEKIWGGRRLETDFGYQIPDGPIGECWAISAHPNGDCRVSGGVFEGLFLSELWEAHHDLFEGAGGDRFPLLVKIIDARESLSVQVHPDDAYAAKHEGGSLGKRECWYVLAAGEGATIVVGQHARGREEFSRMVSQGRWDDLLNQVFCHAGDFFVIEPGTVHAIQNDTLILETQQSSDITYRVWDFDRVQADGTMRALHLDKALDVIDYDMPAPLTGELTAPEVDGVTELMRCENFVVSRVRVAGEMVVDQSWPFLCASVVEGFGTAAVEAAGVEHDVRLGTHFVVPSGSGALVLVGDMTLIVSHLP